MIIKIYIKVISLAVLCLVGAAKRSEAEDDSVVFKGMLQWLSSPHQERTNSLQEDKERTDGLQEDKKRTDGIQKDKGKTDGLLTDEQQVSHVTKLEYYPEEAKILSKNGDFRSQKVKFDEWKGGGGSDSGKRHKSLSTFNQRTKGKHKNNAKQEKHSNKKKTYQKNTSKGRAAKSDDEGSKGHKGHSLRSKGHSKDGKREEGYQKIWHNEESGRQKKFFDNAEEKKYSAEHDHMKAFHNSGAKGAYESNSKKDLHLHDNHGKKLYKKEEGSFDKVLKEEDSHGHRKDYGRKNKFGRKGAHEEVFKSSKGNGRNGIIKSPVGSHSFQGPVHIRKRILSRNSDNDVEESVQDSVATNVPLAAVLSEAGYGQRFLSLPNKNLTSPVTSSSINEIDDSSSRQKDITHKNKIKEKFIKLQNKNRKQLLKIPTKRKNRLSLVNFSTKKKVNNLAPTSGSTETKNETKKRNRGEKRRTKIPNRKIPRVTRRLKKLGSDNKRQSVKINMSLNNKTNLIPIKEIDRGSEPAKGDLKTAPKNLSPISVFVLKDLAQNKFPNTKEGNFTGHKKRFDTKFRNNLKGSQREVNDVEPRSETLHSSMKKPVIIKEPFITISEFENPSEKPKIAKHFNLVTIRPSFGKELSSDDTPTEQPNETQQSNLVVIKPLKKEKSQQISVVSNDSLKPSSSQAGHHEQNKPKKYARFESFDEGHHKKKGKKVEKGGHQEHGYKGKSVKDHGKTHESKFIDKEKKKAKGHKYKDHYEGHYDKGKKGSKGHAHGKKSHSHKGHSDKGFKNSHHKKEYAVKKNYYLDDENKKSHKLFDDFDAYFEKKKKENIEALNYHGGKRFNDYSNKGHHFDDNFHHSKKGKKKNYHHNEHEDHYHHHDYNYDKDDKHGHHYHKDYSPHKGYDALGSDHYNYYE